MLDLASGAHSQVAAAGPMVLRWRQLLLSVLRAQAQTRKAPRRHSRARGSDPRARRLASAIEQLTQLKAISPRCRSRSRWSRPCDAVAVAAVCASATGLYTLTPEARAAIVKASEPA
jgi:hypothetical protein